MSTSSPSPLKFPGFRSRFNKPNNAIKPASSQPNSRPSFIHVSPPPVALFIDPDSWVHSEDSDDDDDEEEEEQELKGESDSLASSNEEGCMENDEMPLSQLLQSRSMNRGEADSTPSRNRHEALAAQPRDPLKFPKVIGSSRPFRSLCPTKDTQRLPPRAAATPVLGVPDQPRSSERQDVFRRMRRRHKEEMHCRHHPQSQSLSRLPQSPSTVIPPLIDDSLYSLLNHAQQCALRQRSDILSNNLKCHLEAFAHEMIQANSLNTQQQQHPQDPHSLFSPCGVGAH
ncbi:hypothetical protein VP01_2800g1 [Puccinia sorghi]|uniref:Uncharacterized protein n=1 Tax=Puccinia sorghi TaxID=27349 RepID=A0A0L6V2I4_9BASI|nr:hypothetical protein VP01_2800g1 [Puccinia sorghi]